MERRTPDSISEWDELRVSRYLDGVLDGEELVAFEEELREREDLRSLVRECAAIDASVSRALAVALAPASSEETFLPDSAAPAFGRSKVFAAAALALIALSIWAALEYSGRAPSGDSPGDTSPADTVATTPAEDAETFGAVRVSPSESLLDQQEWPSRAADRTMTDQAVPAAYLPAVSGPSQGAYFEESDLMTVFDREEKRLYLFELKHARTMIQPARIDL